MQDQNLFFGFTKRFWFSSFVTLALTWWFLHKVGTLITLPFGFSLITAYIFSYPAERLSHKTGIAKGIIAMFIVVLLFASLILFCITFIPVAIRNIYSIVQYIPDFTTTLQKMFFAYIPQSLQATIIESYSQIDNIVPKITKKVFIHFTNLSSFFTQLFTFFVITPIASYYMIKDWDAINRHIFSLIPRQHHKKLLDVRTDIRQKLAGYLVGQIYIIMFFCIFYGIALFVIDLEFGFTIGILTGIATIIPYVGFASGFATAIMVALLKGKGLAYIATVVGIFLSGQVIESSFLTPKLMSNKIQIHPLWIVFGFLVCGVFFGFFGVLFALPITAIASVLIKFYVENYYKKRCI